MRCYNSWTPKWISISRNALSCIIACIVMKDIVIVEAIETPSEYDIAKDFTRYEESIRYNIVKVMIW